MTTDHEMRLASTDKSGRELWKCPVCPRSIILRWSPFEKIVLEEGDPATHTGGKGGLKMGSVTPVPALPDITPEELEWLAGHGIAWEAPKDD